MQLLSYEIDKIGREQIHSNITARDPWSGVKGQRFVTRVSGKGRVSQERPNVGHKVLWEHFEHVKHY